MPVSVLSTTVGLSILIPVYNFDVTPLVHALATQLKITGRTGEIILLDDGSDINLVNNNQSLLNTPFVTFYKNQKNEGRMAARQKLAGYARYDHLLFLDCDSVIIKDDFLSAYFELIDEKVVLASGGRVYTQEPPEECDFMLHWTYGTKRESRKPGNADKKGPGFMSNNFLVKRELFDQLDSSLQLTGYGHEDSWWGIQFEQAGVQCQYINNPVRHGALEKSETFLVKSEKALANLLILEKNVGKHSLSQHVKIFRWYSRLKGSGLSGIYLFFEKPFIRSFRKNLLGCKPNLFYFDCYRLGILMRLAKNH